MSIAAVSISSIFQELQSFYQNRQADLKQLGSALQSGDLNGAQQAFQSLAVLGENGPFANSEPFSKSSRTQAFNTIGEALQAGDLAQAQAAFAALTGKHSHSQATPAAVVDFTSHQHNIEPLTQNPSSIYQLQAYRQQRQADLVQLGQALQSGDLNAAQQAFDALTALGESGPNRNGQPFQRADRAQDFQAIGQALQNGDLAGAQSAFTSLAGTFGKQNQQAQTAISAYNSGATEIIINIVPRPASTGGMPSAPPIGTTPPTEPPVFHPSPTGPPVLHAPPAPSTVAGSAPPNIPEVVINLGGASGSNAASGSSAAELVINLGLGSSSSSGSPEEIQINLANGSAGTTVSIDAIQGKNGASEQVIINFNQLKNYELILNLLNFTSTSQAQTSSSNALSVSA